MDTDTAPDGATDSSADEGHPAQTVRVPNVSPGAKSGLEHIVIGSDALAPDEDTDESDTGEPAVNLPDIDQEGRVAWVADAEDQDEARERADAVWAEYKADETVDHEALAASLHSAVYGKPDDQGEQVPDGLEGEALDAWVSGDAVEGDETDNPDRYAAYQARITAARETGWVPANERQAPVESPLTEDDGSGPSGVPGHDGDGDDQQDGGQSAQS